METATVTPREPATRSTTIAELLPRAVERFGPDPAVRFKGPSGDWTSKTFTEVGEIVRRLSLGLMDLGIQKGDKVAILANTRPEWTYFDFAALTEAPPSCRSTRRTPRRSASTCSITPTPRRSSSRTTTSSTRSARSGLGAEARARHPDDGVERRRDLDGRALGARGLSPGVRVGRAMALRDPRRHLHLHLHVGDHRPAEGMRDLARQLPLDVRHGRGRACWCRVTPPLPAPRALLRAADPAAQLRRRRDARLLGARPAEDPPQPRRGEAPLLPVGAADLREDLHGGHRQGGEGRRDPGGSSRGRSGSARRCARPSGRVVSPGRCSRPSTRSRIGSCSPTSETCSAVRSSRPSAARRRSTPRSCGSSMRPGSWCSRAGE